jgi:3-oxoacyl-[acyl-carrier protein] reductase
MEITLSGRSAIVTGGSKGIGLAIATRFAKSGADVAILARGKESLDEAVAAIKQAANARVIGVQADVGVAADIARAYDEVMKAFGKVDIVVNNAGTSRAMPFEKVTDEILLHDIEQKLFAAVRLIRHVAPQMKERRWGRIINVLNIGRILQGARKRDSAWPRRQGGGVRQSGLLPGFGAGRLHHRHRHQR